MISPLVSRSEFPVFNELTYLNTASMGLMPLSVHQAARRVEEEIALRGTTWFDEVQEIGILERARKAAARLLHAPVDNIAVCTSFTEALCQIAWAFAPPRGSNVVSVDIEFPSVPYPWMRVCKTTGAEMRLVHTADQPERLSFDAVARVVDSNTAVICVSHAQYSTGFRFDLTALAELAHAHGALLVIDATQSAGLVPIDIAAASPDVLIAGGYKWLTGPFGAAFCYVSPSLLEQLNPPFVGWRSTPHPYHFDARRLTLAAAARKLEFSTMSYGAGVALGAAIEYVLELGVERILAHDQRLAARLIDGLDRLGAEVVSPRNDHERGGTVTVRYPGRDAAGLAAALNEAKIIVSPRFGSVRFSMHYYNSSDDVDAALDTFARLVRAY
jgi:selenocysteine lyase/cysteine desulfurase